jgi:hypothetical protein
MAQPLTADAKSKWVPCPRVLCEGGYHTANTERFRFLQTEADVILQPHML